MTNWKVVQSGSRDDRAGRLSKLFSVTIPEHRWVTLPPPIQRRQRAPQAPQAA